jgi:tetratricopeptide (TPR) repeat protein
MTLWGDVKIDDSKADTPAPSSVTVTLYDQALKLIGRQNVSSRGRYRFTNLQRGEYEIVVEAEDREIARTRINLVMSSDIGTRQDFEFEWKSAAAPKPPAAVVSAADVYNRPPASQSIFDKAQEAVGKKKYELAAALLRQILDGDRQDFQVWTLLGTVYLVQEKPADAEKAYESALEVRPAFTLALLNLGRLRASQKRFDEALPLLTRAAETQPQSAEAHYLAGEAYLQIKKGSKAIPHLNEAARLGRPEAHLRLAWLYDAAGMKDKAAVEYEEFLKKRPDHPERKKFGEYVRTNRAKDSAPR